MGLKRGKIPLPKAPVSAETSASDRDAPQLGAFQAGLIVAWKRDLDRGFQLTLAGRRDEFVEVGKLTRYLEGLKGVA